MTKFKVYKETKTARRTLEFQIEVGEVRPGTSEVDTAVDYVLRNVKHSDSLQGIEPLMDSEGIHLTKWLIVDDNDIYWFIPGRTFRKSPAPIKVEYQERCRLGRCVTKNSHYQGGNGNIRAKLMLGICPICGGPAENL